MGFIAVILVYLAVLFALGVFLAFRVKTKEDFIVAGRKLTAPVLVGTLLATWIGSGDIFSVADLSYHHGYSSLIGSAGGWLAIIIVFFIAGRVRSFGQFTVPDILEARYNLGARILGTITTIIASVIIVSYQIRGGGWVLNILSGGAIPEGLARLIVAAFVICYTLLAGMVSVAYLDILNGLVILSGVFLAIPFLLHTCGGLENVVLNVTPRRHFFLGNMTWTEALGYFIPTFLLLLGNANMYQRFFSARDEREAKKAVVGWVVGVILVGVAIQSLAVIGSSFFRGLDRQNSGKIILLVARNGVPLFTGCLLMCAITAIIISTANSFLLVPATNVIRDIYQRLINPHAPDRRILFLSRGVVILLGAAAYTLIQFFSTILEAAYAAYTVYGAAITPPLLATFFWKRATPLGGLTSIIGGMAVTVAWEIAKKILGSNPLDLPAIYPAALCSILLLVGVSLLGPRPSEEKWRPFFKK